MEYKMGEIASLVEAAAIKMGVDPQLARAILIAENTGSGNFNPEQTLRLDTTSPRGARGFGQVMPDTWAGLVREGYLSKDDRPNTKEGQVKAMVAALAEKRKYAGDDPVRLAIAYNAGPSRLKGFTGDTSALPAETQGYIPKVLKNLPGRTTAPASGTFDNVLATVQQVQDQGQTLLRKIQGVTNSFVEDAGIASDTLKQKGDAESRLELTRGQRVVDQQAYMRSLMSAAGIDSEGAAQSFQQKTREMAAAHNEIRALQPEIKALRSVSFLEDPIAWVQAQFKLQATTDRYNATAKAFNDNVAATGALQQLNNRQAALQPGINPDSVLAEARIVAETKKLQADFDLLKVSQQTRQAQLSAYAAELQLGQQQVRSAFDLAQITADQAKRAEMALAKTKSQKDLVAVNAYMERVGRQGFADIASFDSLPPAERAKILKYALVPTTAVAGDPGESLSVLHEFKGYNVIRAEMSDAGKKFLDGYTEQAKLAAKTLRATNLKASDEELFELGAKGIYGSWEKELKLRDYSNLRPDNPHAMNAAVYAQAPELKGNLFAEYVKANPNGGAGLAVKDIISYSIAQVQAGKPAAEVSSQLNKFFSSGMKSQYQSYRLDRLGIPLNNPESNKFEFPISGNVFGVWDRFIDPRKSNPGVPTFDLMNEAQTTQFLILNTIRAGYRGGRDPLGEMQRANAGATKP